MEENKEEEENNKEISPEKENKDNILKNNNQINNFIIPNIKLNSEKQETIEDINFEKDLYENVGETDITTENDVSEEKKSIPKKKSINEIFYLSDIKDFNAEEYPVRKYDKKNFECGKLFFKYRYIKGKIEKSAEKIDPRVSISYKCRPNNISDKRFSIQFRTNNILSLGSPYKNEEIFSNKNEYRKYNGDFLVLIEKSIFHFNLKKYDESYKILFKEKVIYSEKEFGEFLLLINGYNKYLLGTFLAKDNSPNVKKEITHSFIDSIDLKYQQKSTNTNSFLESLRFFLSRIKLPEDSNLILAIMDIYSTCLFNTNKDNQDFISKYSSINAIYLLISTILALNTMLTRKDIKNMNLIKKDQFIDMNKEIDQKEAQDIYEKLEKNPISMEDNYNENNYKRMTILVKKKDNNPYFFKKSRTLKEQKNQFLNNKNSLNNDKNKINDDINQNININDFENKNIPELEEEYEFSKKDDNRINIKNSTKSLKMENDKYTLDQIDNDILKDDELRVPSFSYQENLESFSQKDKEILTKPTKFEKLITKSAHHPRLFVLTENMEKLTWAKDFEIGENSEIKKIKGNVHNLKIEEIDDVYNGINNCELISQYISLFPEESKEANNFITIKTSYKTICLKANIEETAISWFKALKSLVFENKKKNAKDKNKSEEKSEKLKKLIRDKVKEIWNAFILPFWETYGHYLQYKIQNKTNDINKKNKKEDSVSKNGFLEEKTTFSLKDISQFVLNVKKKLNEMQQLNDKKFSEFNNMFLDYNEFFYLYNIGVPNHLRGNLWTLLIGNPCHITLGLYTSYVHFIADIDFEEAINDYKENQNVEQTLDNLKEDEENIYILNQIIIDIIEIRKLFLGKIKNNKVLEQVYRIVRVFFLIRPDIAYNKSLVTFSFLFLLVCKDEYKSFKNIFNLICSTNTLQYYIKNENYINIRVNFFDYLLEKKIPKIREHFKNLDISTELFLVSWFENIFSFTFEFKLLKIIFDLYLLNGEYILFQIGLTIIKIQENELLNLTIGEVFKNLNQLNKKYKEEAFLEKLHMNNIYDEYQKWITDCDVGNQKIKLLEMVIAETN